MLPGLDQSGRLPPGIHECDWDSFAARYGTNPHRQRLLDGLLAAARSLRCAGCATLYVGGSFVTDRTIPGDFDGCWEATGVVGNLLDPVLLDFSNRRAAQKAKYLGELFVATMQETGGGVLFIDFFQRDKETGDPVGIVKIDLRSLP